MSTTGWLVGHELRLTADLGQRVHRVDGTLGGTTLSLEDEAPHRRVDGSEVAVEELLRVVRLRSDPGSLAKLQHGLERGRAVAPGSGHDESVVLRNAERIRVELALDRIREAAHVLAEKRPHHRDGARVADRVAVALLDLGSGDHDVVCHARDGTVLDSRDQPRLAGERLDGLARQERLALVAEGDEDVRLRRVPEHDLERRRSASRTRARRGTTCRTP